MLARDQISIQLYHVIDQETDELGALAHPAQSQRLQPVDTCLK